MASITDNQVREPFLSDAARAVLRRRSMEMIGLALIAAGAILALGLGSYSPADPSYYHATPDAPTNALGLVGSYSADILIRTLGLAAWGLPLTVLIWGARLITHRAAVRVWVRVVFIAPAIVLGAAFLSTHSPFESWPFRIGLGGFVGDGVLEIILDLIPFSGAKGPLTAATLALAPLALFTAAAALGVTWAEAGAALRFLARSSVESLGAIARNLGWSRARLSNAINARLSKTRSEKLGPPHRTVRSRREPRMEPAFDGETETPEPPKPAVRRAPSKSPRKSRRAAREEQPVLALDGFEGEDNDDYPAPPLSLLEKPAASAKVRISDAALEENARMLESVLDDYGVRGEIINVRPGPVVTLYELEPAPGLKASRVIGLADDVARSMSALAARVATVPGRNVIGIELPNATREKVLLREILSGSKYEDADCQLALALGKDIAGDPVIANLARMPHLLIAGTTGSGKSVAINTMILSLLYRLSPKECRVIMIDPKMLELSVYDGIPHLLAPVVTDPKKAVVALKWVVREMEERYRKMSKVGARNIDGYNQRIREAMAKGEDFKRVVQTGYDEATGQPIYEEETFAPEEIPMIVVIVDEMADLMMVAGKEIEACIQRLAQMARASGIHLIMATQRPSVDVITGTIKANFPTRISFQVTSKIDSRTILGEQGAEQLLGMGDMLYMSGGGRVTRVHGPFVSDEEVEQVVKHLKRLGAPKYVSAVTDGGDDGENASAIDEILGLGGGDGDDQLYDRAVAIIAHERKASTSFIQRKLQIGYNRAARIIEQMEEQGVVSPANHVGKREVLVGDAQ